MKFLLLALLSCICSADDRRSRYTKQWARRIDSVPKIEEPIVSTWNRYADWMAFATARLHRYNFDPVSGRFHEDHIGDRVEVRHPIRHRHRQFRSMESNGYVAMKNWPVKKEAVVEGDLVLGGLMMVHEREDTVTCGPVMPQGGVQALEAMLYTLDILNEREIVPGVKIGAHILDDCDKDTYGLEMAVDFIKGTYLDVNVPRS
ncbi:uncharacterized protein LOC113563212 [Ooceraea biroi]|uniref:uncharacterized protein LOC113563212 n=1 Tax=Ooceraea biroi TaxID=2015173 RepID=UPI000F087A93|nr:uncharacterized protein LOC113563212 [Ooceraea biroi]